MNQKHNKRPLIIIGTGPAGMTAAIYAARANLSPIVFEGKEPGGQLTLTTDIENFPGFIHGINGPELMNNMRSQAERFGAEFLGKKIVKTQLNQRPFQITTEDGEDYFAETLILSTGASAKFLGLPREKELTGKGVSTCATCDGFFYRDRIVHVVGGGDTAMEDATFITKFAKKVYVIHRRDKLKASKPMIERAMNNPKIEFIWNSEVVEILEKDQSVVGIKVKNLVTAVTTERPTDGLFYAIGHTPNTTFLEGQISTDENGFIKTIAGTPDTNIPGVFACGDVQDSYYRQAITAAGSGCMAAMRAERWLENSH
ncbi:MAG: thioredoxin-disulfide reductase [Bacteriovoracaceae bacterium]|nr:thioredoxin-disulfide reductase [Bacteriovoracaceae bacterium]